MKSRIPFLTSKHVISNRCRDHPQASIAEWRTAVKSAAITRPRGLFPALFSAPYSTLNDIKEIDRIGLDIRPLHKYNNVQMEKGIIILL
jgi:hypothetical protein